MKQDPSKILLIRFSSIGDILLTTPVIRALRTRFPSAQIDFLVKPAFAGLLNDNPRLSNVVTLDQSVSATIAKLQAQPQWTMVLWVMAALTMTAGRSRLCSRPTHTVMPMRSSSGMASIHHCP